ncbi:serine/threonine-protein kinase [Polyangium sp. 6x1]|uniref:serine/threonine-protein kinase n=1 Tax=Polyangium sp. 6x1 TaxID=3042689 RepID=UPI002482C8B0|nr:serine/threonine-protein kinase [Polyangium sp. 6x1]MDI1442713.1 protein kinase [Polyangium sp. 6x1]
MRYGRPRRDEPGQTQDATVEQAAPPRLPRAEGDETPVAAPGGVATEDASPPADRAEHAPPDPGDDVPEIPPVLYSRFEAFEFLGRGGMGAVYKARDVRLGREVAVKLLFGAEPELGGSLLREARSQARIKHENVCEVYEAGTADHVRFIVMQLIHGEPLDKVKSAMSLEEKVRVVRQVASALHEAHRLGLVHRDVKPANIMVERGEDGAWKPYIMDFGLAREMGDSGSTVSGALMGTPAFMSPEQAAGKVRSLDRRTDVYCLGATLYDVLVGRPPIVADALAALLQGIMHEEPLAPRQIEPELPLDLDAIVMKCLEKQPAARYDSAKALGDDLERFLDGEPVAALKRARLYALIRRAKRHKVKLSITSVVLVVATVFVGGWVSERARAEKQATLARELGESVKEMEFFLRNAHGLPLHDIDRERSIVRGRLQAIASAISAAGDIGVGPGHYALGRGYLALQEPEEAVAHLRQAEAAGYRAAGLDYAMGMALSEIYKKELADTKRMEGERKKQRIAAIEAEYKQPALVHLRAALGGTIDAPAYAEGLIAFYEGRNEDALAKAREAFEKAPWLYEAKKLEGDVLFAIGKKYGHDAAFDFEKMSKGFGEAGEAYRAAAEIGSSDPAVHFALCELATQEMCGAYAHGSPMRPHFEAGKAACGRTVAVNPGQGAGHVSLAQLHSQYAWRVAASSAPGKDTEEALSAATRHAEEAASKNAEDPMAPYVVGLVWRSRVMYEADRGLDVVPAVDHAIAAYDEALKRDPFFVWALNESCSSYYFRGERDFMHGIDPRKSFDEGLARCRRATEVAPDFAYAKITAIGTRVLIAEQKVSVGQSPRDIAREAEDAIEHFRQQSPGSSLVPRFRANLALSEAAYLLESGGDPTPAVARAEALIEEYARLAPGSNHAQHFRGQAASVRARSLLERGEDPSPWVKKAREELAKATEAKPWNIGYRLASAIVETLALGWALRSGQGAEAEVDAALASPKAVLDVEHADPRLHQVLGELWELRAALRMSRREDGAHEIKMGLDRIERALAIHPRMALALACKGRLFLLRASLSKERRAEQELGRKALDAFDAAIRENPLLERRERSNVEAARRLAQ